MNSLEILALYLRAYTEINLGGAKYAQWAQFFLPSPPPQGLLGRGQNSNCKFKTFGFLDTLKVK